MQDWCYAAGVEGRPVPVCGVGIGVAGSAGLDAGVEAYAY